MEKIQWGIIGCGEVTELKSGPAFNLINGSEIVAVMRRNAEKAKDYAIRHNVANWYSNADEIINDPKVNALYIATPPNVHAEYAIKALKARKAVYVEKPMARNFDECQQMIMAAKLYNTPLYVAYYRRALPGFLQIKQWLDAGVIGKVSTVNIQLIKPLSANEKQGILPWRVDPTIAGGGHFFDLASHQLDYMHFLFGELKVQSAEVKNKGEAYIAEDFVQALFCAENDITIHGVWDFASLNNDAIDAMEIIGSEGSIKFSCFGFNPIALHTKKGVEYFDFQKPRHVQQAFIEQVVDSLLGKRELPINAESAAQTNKLMDEVVKDYYKHY